MTKRKYLRRLRKALGRIPESEKEELIEYYAEIIDESYERGKTTREIFATLESPEQVASDYFNANEGSMNERRRRPTRDEYFSRGRDDYDDYDDRSRRKTYERQERRTPPKKRSAIVTVLLIPVYIVGFILALAASIVVLSLLVADVALVAGFGIAGLYTLIMSFGLFPSHGMLALAQIGAAAAFFGLAMLFEVTVKPLSKGVGAFFRLLFHQENRSSGTVAQSHWLAAFVVGLIFLLIGCGMGWFGFNQLGNDWQKLAVLGEYVEQTKEITVETGGINLKSDNIRIKVIPVTDDNEQATLVYTESTELPLEYSEEAGTVTLKNGGWSHNFWEYTKQVWSRGILFSAIASVKCEATLYLPSTYRGDLSVTVNNGTLTLDGSSGTWKNAFGSVSLVTDNGVITVCGVKADNILADSDNGYISFDNVWAQSIDVSTDNGAIKLKETTGYNTLKGKTQNGRIECVKVVCPDISFQVSNGSVDGTIVGEVWQYSVETKVHNGSCNLKDSSTGDKKLYVRVSNGSIKLNFVTE